MTSTVITLRVAFNCRLIVIKTLQRCRVVLQMMSRRASIMMDRWHFNFRSFYQHFSNFITIFIVHSMFLVSFTTLRVISFSLCTFLHQILKHVMIRFYGYVSSAIKSGCMNMWHLTCRLNCRLRTKFMVWLQFSLLLWLFCVWSIRYTDKLFMNEVCF